MTPQKKRSEHSALKSTKEIFDWDANTLQQMRTENSEPKNYNRKVNFMMESKVFDDTPVKQSKQANSKCQFQGTGDIFTWKDSPKDTLESSGKKRGIDLRPSTQTVEINLYKTKSNRTSDDNVLFSSRY
jgi:hypothetical protein